MKRYRVSANSVPRHAVVRLTFDDGLTGDLDLSSYVAKGGCFEPLRDPAFFERVSIGMDGRCFGRRLDDDGNEIDFSADGARADIETAMVQARAELHRRKLQHAAE